MDLHTADCFQGACYSSQIMRFSHILHYHGKIWLSPVETSLDGFQAFGCHYVRSGYYQISS